MRPGLPSSGRATRRFPIRLWIWILYLAAMLSSPLGDRELLLHAHGDAGHHVHSLSARSEDVARLADAHAHEHAEHPGHDHGSPESSEPSRPSESGVVVSVPAFLMQGSSASRLATEAILLACFARIESAARVVAVPPDETGRRPRASVRELDRGSGVRALLQSSHALLI